MITELAVVIVFLLVALAIYASTKPDAFRVERTTQINAEPQQIFALINELKAWNAWSPWEKKDPEMKRTFEGPDGGAGACYAWEGNKNVGAGRMKIVESTPPSKIVIQLDFIKPFEGHNTVEFTLVPNGDTTVVTWVMFGPMPFISKLMSVFVSMDKMCGKDFEAGLAQLKAVAES